MQIKTLLIRFDSTQEIQIIDYFTNEIQFDGQIKDIPILILNTTASIDRLEIHNNKLFIYMI